LETTITNEEHISSTASLAGTMHSSAKSSVESAEAIYSNYTHTSLTSRSMIPATGSCRKTPEIAGTWQQYYDRNRQFPDRVV
jgi:hypothetical protein